jgi:hypothetical protein
MRRDQEDRLRQGLRTVFKPMKERYGRTDESHCGGFYMFGPVKEALRGRFSSVEELVGAMQNWLKTQPKFFFLTELKNL